MAWLWDSWKEYVDFVDPISADSPHRVRQSQRESWLENQHALYKAVGSLEEQSSALYKLGFKGKEKVAPAYDQNLVDQAELLVMDAVYAGEELLLYHKKLAKSKAAYGFLHQHRLPDNWSRYAGTRRIVREICQFVSDLDELLRGFEAIVGEEAEFIVSNLDLPPLLESDFRLARNLFSVGFDEVGLLMSGRGLEGVLRRIAEVRNISLEVKGRKIPAFETYLRDLIETMYQLRWKTKGTRLISAETKAFLQYIRTIRNSGAHSAAEPRLPVNLREKALLAAETANRLWSEVSQTKARISPTLVQKTW